MGDKIDEEQDLAYVENVGTVIGWLREWISEQQQKHNTKITDIFKDDKGWEVWAQVDIAWHIRQYMKGNWKLTREEPVYHHPEHTGKEQAADFVIWHGAEKDESNQKAKHIIELKCNGFSYHSNFGHQVQTDWTKLEQELKGPYKAAKRWSVAIEPEGNWGDALILAGWTRCPDEPMLYYRYDGM